MSTFRSEDHFMTRKPSPQGIFTALRLCLQLLTHVILVFPDEIVCRLGIKQRTDKEEHREGNVEERQSFVIENGAARICEEDARACCEDENWSQPASYPVWWKSNDRELVIEVISERTCHRISPRWTAEWWYTSHLRSARPETATRECIPSFARRLLTATRWFAGSRC